MGASDLLRSPLIGADQDGELLGGVVRAGRPNLQTAMPRYDFTPAELTDLAGYIHYLRQAGRYADLTAEPREQGDSKAGESYFSRRCASCHSVDSDLKGLASKYEGAALRSRVLRPPAFAPIESSLTAGRRAHLQLLEQHSEMDFANLLAYLQAAAR
jgi:mono/diheme cytochrome c family protein